MFRISLLSFIFFCFSISIFAQGSINEYKYIIVPSQFEFQKNEDQYQLNSLTKFLFNKYGYTSFLSSESFPEDLGNNKCLGLTAHLRKNANMFVSKMYFNLVNCKNEVVFTSKESVSKKKNYKDAYHEAVRETFNDIKSLNYKYLPNEVIVIDTKEIQNKSDKTDVLIVNQGNTTTENKKIVYETQNLLFAQPILNGFQLVDSTPKRLYSLQKTSVKDVFILKDMNGILYKSNDIWFAEYYIENELVKKELSIKF